MAFFRLPVVVDRPYARIAALLYLNTSKRDVQLRAGIIDSLVPVAMRKIDKRRTRQERIGIPYDRHGEIVIVRLVVESGKI